MPKFTLAALQGTAELSEVEKKLRETPSRRENPYDMLRALAGNRVSFVDLKEEFAR